MNALTVWLMERFPEVAPREFYRMIFPEGELEKREELVTGKYTGIIVAITGRKKRNGQSEIYRYTVTDDLDAVDAVCASDHFCICSPISYCGKQRTADHARFMYAMAVDVDHLRMYDDGRPLGLINLWERHIQGAKRLPCPTFIVSSGSGLHLYYVLEQPVPLFRNVVDQLQEYKRELTRLIWHDTIVDIKSVHDIQQEGIFQGFRMPGTVTKFGDRAVAFRTGKRVTIDYLSSFVEAPYRITEYVYKSKLTLAEAAKKYPDWYERRVVRKERPGTWAVNRAVYDWWLRQIRTKATVGHRYYCMMTLAMYARKCGQFNAKQNPDPVTREELERDCFSLVEEFDALTEDESNHFDNGDVLDALEAYDNKWITYPRDAIGYRSGIPIPPNKRNGRKQSDHIQIMNFIRDQINHNTTWNKVGNGRKSKREQVQAWRLENPDGIKAECIRETGMDRKTVSKHWD